MRVEARHGQPVRVWRLDKTSLGIVTREGFDLQDEPGDFRYVLKKVPADVCGGMPCLLLQSGSGERGGVQGFSPNNS